jgi:cyclophilin family peptidyl-prolyl cis-trans isomerase
MKHICRMLGAWCFLAAFQAGAAAPVILSQPQSLTVNNASAAAFTVVATNAAACQWRFSGTNTAGATNLPGATNATLSLDNVTSNQAGNYTVVVTSPDNLSVTSAPPAVLTIIPGTILQFTLSKYPNGGSSNVVVQLFDHDKPATVQNFVHYIRSGAYSNMFFDRLLPGFVLQGGDWFAEDQTNSTPPPLVGQIYQTYVQELLVNNPPLPQQVDSEFFVGPTVSNRQGTIAMALSAGDADSAANAFFFNLVDNANLDVFTNDQGPFTVFGRVVSGSNVLQYFNNTNEFSKPAFTTIPTNNIFTNGIFDEIYLGGEAFTDLPVNYHGSAIPADASLFFVSFTFITQPVVDTNPPTVSITSPAPNAVLANGAPLTVTGTASDNVGLARVVCSLIPLTGEYGGNAFGGNALGATNWSLFFGQLEPGSYNILATSQDGAGNLSQNVSQQLTVLNPPPDITGIAVSGTRLTLTATNGAAGGQYVLLGTTNIATPSSRWTRILTNNFDGNGNLNLSTNILNPPGHQQFFILTE